MVEQNAEAVIESTAKVKAGGGVTVKSDADADVTTSVTAAKPEKGYPKGITP